MANQVVVSPGVYTSEKDLSFVAASVGLTSLGITGEAVRGPAFQPIFVQDYDTYKTYFDGENTEVYTIGSTLVPRYESSYIARSYLSESNNMWMTRVLGSTGYDATEGMVINVMVDVLKLEASLRGGGGTTALANYPLLNSAPSRGNTPDISGATACVIRARKASTAGGSTMGQAANAIRIYKVLRDVNCGRTITPCTNPSNSWENGGSDLPTNAYPGGGLGDPTTLADMVSGQWNNASDDFWIACQEGATTAGNTIYYRVSLNPSSNNYILKVLGSDPYYDITNSPDQRLYVDQIYINSLKALGKKYGGSSGVSYLDSFTHMSFNGIGAGWSNYTDTWQPTSASDGPTTPWIYSEVRGNDVVKLFRLITIADGDTANKFLKFSILNIDIDNDTFDLAVRAYGDTDTKQTVYESYRNVSMNPGSQNYIGKKIGTLNGDYPLRSRYIMVELADNAPIDAIPAGYEGYPITDLGNLSGTTANQVTPAPGVGTAIPGSAVGNAACANLNTACWPAYHSRVEPNLFYNTSYDIVNDNIRKTYLGLSTKIGYDSDIFKYKGCSSTRGTACAAAWTGRTYGFHLDARLSGSSFVGNTNRGDTAKWYSGSTGNFPFFTDSTKYTSTACGGKYYGNNPGITNGNSTGCDPAVGTVSATLENIYSNKKYRKFTLAPYGGFDGWDINKSTRTNTDLYKENGTSYLLGYGSANTYTYSKTSDFFAFKGGIDKYANPEEVDINLFVTPGLDYTNNLVLTNHSIEMIEDNRADSLYVLTAENYKNQTVDNAVSDLENANLSSSYVATYWPWIQYNDTANNVRIYIPPTAEVVKNMAMTDNVAFPWFATAGYTRGLINATKVRKNLTQDDRDDLYEARINPIANFTATGPVIWGNKTLQTTVSALDRINVRRLMLRARKLISAVAVRLVFEQNDEVVRQEFLSLVNPILDDIRRDRGLTDFKVVVSSDPEEIDQNKLTGKIYLKPTRSLEFIEIEFNITPTATSFDDI
tara:strand:- start:375 stop:3356 length:2982 start_codon:yes stop_codon:yes gene_type:complete